MSVLLPIAWETRPHDCAKTHFYLLMTGHLMAAEAGEINPHHPEMMCGECGENPLDLIWKHDPLPADYFISSRTERTPRTIPGTTWGEDITPICRCCSFSHCTHRQIAANKVGTLNT